MTSAYGNTPPDVLEKLYFHAKKVQDEADWLVGSLESILDADVITSLKQADIDWMEGNVYSKTEAKKALGID